MALTCSRCGAPLDAEMERCPYCNFMTAYGESLLETRRKQERESVRQGKRENLPVMKHISILGMVFLYIITLGFYGPHWYVLRMSDLNKLQSNTKLSVLPIVQIALCWIALSDLFGVTDLLPFPSENVDDIITWVLLALFILSIVLAFRVKKILCTHTLAIMQQEPDSVELYSKIAPSGLMLFLFGPLYLQYTINKMFRLDLLSLRV